MRSLNGYVKKQDVSCIIFVGIRPTTYEGRFSSTSNEGQAFPPFILVTCHMAFKMVKVEAPFNFLITL